MNRNMKPVQNLFTRKILMIKSAVKEMRSAKCYAILLASVILVGIFSLSPAISTLMNNVIVRSNGRIFVHGTANSGSSEDIQATVDEVAAIGGGDVYIPEGTFDFVEIGYPWQTVYIPAGVNLFGATTTKDANGQVVEWRTILTMPYEAPDMSLFFEFEGNGDPAKPSRFSDIALIGYREIEPTSETMYRVISMNNVVDFQIDHCLFKNTGEGIWVGGPADCACCGVIDHCKFINEYGVPAPYPGTVGYGVGMGRLGSQFWEDNIDQVIGHYTPYTVFIEDCYFSRWRHCISSNDGAHYVFRHNTIQHDHGYGSLDAHGTYSYIGTRAVEIYDNQLLDSLGGSGSCMWIRGSGGCIYNNYVRGYGDFIRLGDEGPVEKCWIHDMYIWNNDIEHGMTFLSSYSEYRTITENVDYFLHEKSGYTPYSYPHPLTLEAYP